MAEEREKNPPLSLEEKNKKKLSAIEAAHEDGNIHLKLGKYEQAFAIYERGVLILNGCYGLDEEEQQKINKHEVAFDLNMALCKLKLERWTEAIDNCKMVLNIDKNNVKATYRKGLAFIGLGEYEKATDDFKTVLQLQPSNGEAKAQLELIKKRLSEQREKSKKFNEKMALKMKTSNLS